MIKKSICLLVFILLLSLLTACGDTNSTTTDVADSSAAVETPTEDKQVAVETPTPEPTPTPEEIIEEAMTEGRNYYYALNGATADNDKALEAFQKAADLDCADAYYYIGRIHDRAKEYDDAKIAYEKSAELGNSMAKLGLGELYLAGNGVETDYSKAGDLFNDAVNDGCVEANAGLGDLYQEGFGVEADINKAIGLFESAIQGTEPEWLDYANSSLAFVYSGNNNSIPQDIDKVNQYVDAAIDISKDWSTDRYFWAGQLYLYYLNDPEKGLQYLEEAAGLNDTNAIRSLGYIYENGDGVKKDYAKALEWYEKGEALNDAGSLNNLGWMYEHGEGVDTNFEKALKYYESAAELSDNEAYNNLGRMYRDGSGVAQDYSKAIEYFEKGVDSGSYSAATNLAMMYAEGKGVDKDFEIACDYFARAAAIDGSLNSDAMDSIINLVGDGLISQEKANEILAKYPTIPKE